MPCVERTLGTEDEWVVDVVLRARGHEAAQERVIAKVAEALGTVGSHRPPNVAYSYDMPPPDGSIGVSCWVRADSASDAVATTLRVVTDAATEVTGSSIHSGTCAWFPAPPSSLVTKRPRMRSAASCGADGLELRQSALQVVVGEFRRGAGQPAVDDCLAQGAFADLLELDQHRGVAVEVRDREEALPFGRKHGFLLAEVVDAHREDGPSGGRRIAEPLDVGLAERALPCERLAGDRPRAVVVALALGDAGQLH